MSMAQPKKEFSAERLIRRRRGEDAEPEAVSMGSADSAAILEAITALREEVADLKQSVRRGGDIDNDMESGMPEPSTEVDEMAKDVRIEIAQMVRVIARTKQEIAQIKHPFATEDEDQIVRAHSELDEIVLATERATQGILEATEKMEASLSTLAAMAEEDQEMLETLDQFSDQITTILEACNFQDITGQRITKVVKTVRFIEDRILAMIAIWGAQAFEDLPVQSDLEDEGLAEPGDDALLQGPQLGNEGISQAEIDALFD